MLNNILCGPILRSTTRNRICVWVALDCALDLTLEILDLNENPVGRSDSDELKSCRFQLGNGLHVYLLQAYPLDTQGQVDKNLHYQTRKFLYYWLKNGESTIDLKEAKLTYGAHKYPVFHIPEKLNSVLHGSCRKPHGINIKDENNDADCLTIGDDLLKTHHSDIDKRPDLLLLTGDQIYADDVEASLLHVLREQAEVLVGYTEILPLTGNDNSEQCSITPKTIPLGERKLELRKHHSGLSSSQAGNHLLSFGEFAAMYIYVFGNARNWQKPQCWEEIEANHIPLPKTATWLDRIPSRNGQGWWDYLKTWRIKSLDTIIAEKKAAIQDDLTAVNIFSASESLLKVRRLLANIPTYMIFDDHDVTDDWNITGHWYDKVRSSPVGRRVVSNALAAYWAFQGWGNDPDNFDSDMIASITEHLNNANDDAVNGEHYDLLTWKHRGWGFSIATNPPIIVMDSRTQRQPNNASYPPRLMDRYALDWLRVEWSKLKTCEKSCHDNAVASNKDTCPVLVATTLVFGFSPLEHIIRILLWVISYIETTRFIKPLEKLINKENFLTSLLINHLDAEAWTSNLDGFTAFLDTILHKMDIERCVFLSGDVHYSFSEKCLYRSGTSHFIAGKTLNFYQLTSSSLRNEPNESQQKALNKMERLEEGRPLWQQIRRLFRRLMILIRGWRKDHELLEFSPPPADISQNKRITAQCNLGQVIFDANGLPVTHTLWFTPHGSANRVDYDLSKGRKLE